MAAEDEDILHQYKMINNKLKKKFMRRTNLNEPIEQFSLLAVSCERMELPQYAGLCWASVVNCELNRKNYVDAAFISIKAADQFMEADRAGTKSGCFTPSDEYLQAALNYYTRSRTFLKDHHTLEKPLNWKTIATTSHALDVAGRSEEALNWLQKMASGDLNENDLLYLEKLTLQLIKVKNYVGALEHCNKIIDSINFLFPVGQQPFGIYTDLLQKYEIIIILLLLILKPNPRKLSAIFSNILEKYTWIEDSFNSPESILPEKLFFLMQSLVMNCQIKNVTSAEIIEKQLIPYLDEVQIDLLRILIKSLK